jgi:hypothetical protein
MIALLLAACHLPHVDPARRLPDQELASIMRLDVSCGGADPFSWMGGLPTPAPDGSVPDDQTWVPSGTATGVVVSEWHVLTAAHAVRCPVLPSITATLPSGRVLPMSVELDDFMFGEGADVARLVISDAEAFDLGVAPPRLARAREGERLAAVVRRRLGAIVSVGTYRGHGGIVDGIAGRPGDSGAPVYDAAGELVGIILGGALDGSYVRYYPIEGRWLAGT